MTALRLLQDFFEVLGGSRRPSERLERSPAFALLLGAWWVFLLALALSFASGVKFIYVDF